MDTKGIFQSAMLSEASYADFDGIDLTKDDDVKTALTKQPTILGIPDPFADPVFTESQAQDFVDHWKVISHQPNTVSGFSATLFESKDNSGQFSLAIRGTEGFFSMDTVADLFGVALQGVARTQALTSGDTGLGKLNASVKIDITGHSLGGHLSMLFSRMFPQNVNHIYTYNGAGLGGIVKEIAEVAGYNNNDVPNSRVTNIVAEKGFDFTATAGYIIDSSERDFIEESSGITGIDSHSISKLIDALAVSNLLHNLSGDAKLSLGQIGSYLDAASNKAEESLEKVVNAIGNLLGKGTTVTTDDRDKLYQRIGAIEGAGQTGQLRFHSVESLAEHATADNGQGQAYRYALVNLNTFAITGLASLYTAQADELKAKNFTEQYLSDRVAMLREILTDNAADKPYIGVTESGHYYRDAETAAAGAIISFVCPKETNQRKRHPDTALIPQSALFFGLARNSLRSNSALTDP
ncbi:MAG: hypothetical protein DRQ61_05750, partial [Gammaproteobacteria bacterium]